MAAFTAPADGQDLFYSGGLQRAYNIHYIIVTFIYGRVIRRVLWREIKPAPKNIRYGETTKNDGGENLSGNTNQFGAHLGNVYANQICTVSIERHRVISSWFVVYGHVIFRVYFQIAYGTVE